MFDFFLDEAIPALAPSLGSLRSSAQGELQALGSELEAALEVGLFAELRTTFLVSAPARGAAGPCTAGGYEDGEAAGTALEADEDDGHMHGTGTYAGGRPLKRQKAGSVAASEPQERLLGRLCDWILIGALHTWLNFMQYGFQSPFLPVCRRGALSGAYAMVLPMLWAGLSDQGWRRASLLPPIVRTFSNN